MRECVVMTPEPDADTFVVVRGTLQRYIEWERRWGLPVNDFAVKVYEWLFVVTGPLAIVLGAVFIATGFLAGALLLVIGVGMSWVGWRRLIRFARDLRRTA
jgi:hypothetical protein